MEHSHKATVEAPKTILPMNKRAEERLSMFYAVRAACTDHAMAWNNSVPMVEAAAMLDVTIGKLERAAQIQEERRDGVAMAKRAKLEEMMERTLVLVRAMFVYAVDNGDAVLQGKASISRTRLVRTRDAVVASVCLGVHNLAMDVLPALAPYGITVADTQALRTAIESYTKALSSPRTEMVVRMGATKNIDALVRECMRALRNKMDLLVSNLRTSAPEFHREYFNARRVVTSGVRMRKAA